MAIFITNECINCGQCEPECPNNAIYDDGVEWTYNEGNNSTGEVTLHTGEIIDTTEPQPPINVDKYYIVPDKCTECVGFHEEPQCAAVCPVDCCVPDPNIRESEEELLNKKDNLHMDY